MNEKSNFGRIENIVGRGENAGYEHFLLFPTMFSKAFFLSVVKSRDINKELNFDFGRTENSGKRKKC